MKINLVVIKTDKVEEQKNFYSLLGCQFEYHKHGNGVFHYSTYIGQVVFEIYPLPQNVNQPDITTRLGFSVDDLDGLLLNLKNMGIKIISEPNQTAYGYVAVVEDLDGRKIEISEK